MIILPNTIFGRSYPLKEISQPRCKYSNWSQHTKSCKQKLPIIENANYKKYKDDIGIRLVYTVLWSSTYENGWDVGYGSHLGVDIASAKGTPVYSIGDGTVLVAGWLRGRGYSVVIKHNFDGRFIYSVYSHLSEVNVVKSINIKEGDKIGEIGSTGNSWGNHLHFQIDINQKGYHPYYYSECKGSPGDIVNSGKCRNLVTQNTIDPIVFLETNGAQLKLAKTQEDIPKISKEINDKKKIKASEIITRTELIMNEIQLFLARHKIYTSNMIPANTLKKGENGDIKIYIKKKSSGKKITTLLPAEIEISYTNSILDVFPNKIKYVDGNRYIKITGLKTGTGRIIIKMGNKIIANYMIRVYDQDTKIDAEHAFVTTLGKPYIGKENRAVIVMKDKNHENIIGVPYKGDFLVRTSSNTRICPIYIKSSRDIENIGNNICYATDYTNQFSFNYNDTFKGIMVVKTIPINLGKHIISVIGQNKLYGSNYIKNTRLATDLNPKDKYYKYILVSFMNNISRLYRKSYFAPDFQIKESDAIIWIKNAFPNAKNKKGDKYKYITRLEFMRLFSELTGIKSQNTKKTFRDIDNSAIKYTNILSEKNIKFLDEYGDKYFQPNKKILRKEVAYLLIKLQEKYNGI